MDKTEVIMKEVDTPLGVIVFASSPKGLCLLDFKYRKSFPTILKRIEKLYGTNKIQGTSSFIEQAEQQLQRYLLGQLQQFTVPLDIRGSIFQLKVWQALLQIKYGKTVSYLDIAKKINQPEAVRAVANANGQNGIAIIIPCHRVIGSDGSLTGYGGGLPIKKRLLQIESGKKQGKITNFL
ncbi:Methylated-DNA--protein-cysteine methyltransferase [Candidatus Lokiarchaeum ossiferum]|uniref:Methylated-DNA--protein-cysteine methyltransferase n=1 Tax=Candidatus Lokiarchaeum ossiferum TaxID=2951803 RepID=A0ABY6HU07_9ARCH|nr:Methylated-DNA--protein-cysteine methyltransferase [Candidatus Lokiarchaeum sp. B-35]